MAESRRTDRVPQDRRNLHPPILATEFVPQTENRAALTRECSLGGHAVLRAFVPVFRAVRGFFRAAGAAFLVLATVVVFALPTVVVLVLTAVVFLALPAIAVLLLVAVVLLFLATASTGAGNSSLGCFAVR